MTASSLADGLLDFRMPPGSEATGPPESRGLARDAVRLLVASPMGLQHRRFHDIVDVLTPGDLVVVNTSATLPAAVTAARTGDRPSLVHVAGELDDGSWVVEVRAPDNTGPERGARAGEHVALRGGVALTLAESYPRAGVESSRLWRADPSPRVARTPYLMDHGQPVRYGYLSRPWPLRDLQNVYAQEPGSAEMPSAGRPLTPRVIVQLVARGIAVAPIVLHTGVSSPEQHEPPAPERFAVPEVTARLVNSTREGGGRVVAVGTTVTRALETVVDGQGRVSAGSGWTDLVLGPKRPAHAVTGLVTGLHQPEASHLLLLEAVAGRALVRAAYRAATSRGYLWHEFGDAMLFLP
jgi:S-adenosylmethionine:tRNA ribosyltransferase-isomerase